MNLIFDFDGVIGNTQRTSAEATAIVDDVDFDTAFGLNLKYASNKPNHTRDHNLTEAEMQVIFDWTEKFGTEMQRIGFELFDDFVKEILRLSTPHKAVVSSGSRKYVVPAMERTKISPSHILAFENHHSKEEKIEVICEDWGVSISDTYYFTDTLADVYELKNFIDPKKLIGVSWGYCGREMLATVLQPEFILDKPSDIRKLFWDTSRTDSLHI